LQLPGGEEEGELVGELGEELVAAADEGSGLPAAATASDVEAIVIAAQLREANPLFTIAWITGVQDEVVAIDPHVQIPETAIVQELFGA
jgi:hypothetical protein